ncbi:LysR substrate-binding domain-containing protein [Chitinilyticum piscinae]|uniref:LysR family transcriptional regulator n=1 Tax=Chitinilyticum piscinae TaxID=2866724 RepID=A0A8J7FG51_9NEIS|nr:LysR substrate-binding domain-containing protein [Chitinilyticum piscinae]MBE9608455.1 LysR family transcriptional regulator [Chitinilyticum piscinae]
MNFRLNFHHLRYFWHVAREGSITGAAGKLGLRAQTLSHQISQLEQQLGRALFAPQGRGLTLTDTGREVLRYADQIFLLGEELLDSLEGDSAHPGLRLSVGVTDVVPKNIACQLLGPALALPQPLRLTCHEGSSDELLAELALHQLDLVLSDRPLGSASAQQFHCVELARCPVWVFAAPLLAERWADNGLDGAPFLLPSRGNMLRSRLDQWFATEGLRVNVAGEFDDIALLQAFGRRGLGLFAAPAFAPDDLAGDGSLLGVGLLEGVEENLYAITTPRKRDHPAVRAILREQ